jgi:hypothetical protein
MVLRAGGGGDGERRGLSCRVYSSYSMLPLGARHWQYVVSNGSCSLDAVLLMHCVCGSMLLCAGCRPDHAAMWVCAVSLHESQLAKRSWMLSCRYTVCRYGRSKQGMQRDQQQTLAAR